jgi:hypothetical protein
MNKDNKGDGRQNNRPPGEHMYKPGESGNPLGRPKKVKSTFESEIKSVFGQKRDVTIDGQTQNTTMRQLILEQIARGAAKGDPRMIKLSLPFLKIMDDAPEFEILPEDKKVIQNFLKRFSDDGGAADAD